MACCTSCIGWDAVHCKTTCNRQRVGRSKKEVVGKRTKVKSQVSSWGHRLSIDEIIALKPFNRRTEKISTGTAGLWNCARNAEFSNESYPCAFIRRIRNSIEFHRKKESDISFKKKKLVISPQIFFILSPSVRKLTLLKHADNFQAP